MIANIVEVVCGDIFFLVARVERLTESTHFTCSVAARILCVIARKAIAQRLETVGSKLEMNSRCLDHFFTGNHPDDAIESDFGVFTDFQEMFWVQFGRRFAELFKGEEQPLAWSGIKGGYIAGFLQVLIHKIQTIQMCLLH